ncbi:MAG: ABC transporter ATP-binding protein [Spirochaetota bacterium]
MKSIMDNSNRSIRVEGLRKNFDDVAAVDSASFDVQSGELFGFLGPNGAGKTTTINMLTGLARSDSGSVEIGGIDCTHDTRAAQHLVGVVPDESNLYPELTGYENLCFCASLYGIRKRVRRDRACELLDLFGLADAAHRKFAGYSKGMKRKLTIAAGIIHEPAILFLDEPTTGIDVASARQLRQLIARLNRQGTTIFLTTHYIEEAERLCHRVAFIVSGRIVKVNSVKELVQPFQDRNIVQITCERYQGEIWQELEQEFTGLTFTFPGEGIIRVESATTIRAGMLVRYLEDRGIEVLEARRIRPSLEDVFVKVTGIEAGIMNREKEKSGGGQ